MPEHHFAVVSLANAGPDGLAFNQAVVRWALRTYLGVTDRDPEPLAYDKARTRDILGSYANDVMTVTVSADNGRLWLATLMRPEIRAGAEKDLPPDHTPFDVGLLPGDGDEYVITVTLSRDSAASSPERPAGRWWASISAGACSVAWGRTAGSAGVSGRPGRRECRARRAARTAAAYRRRIGP